MLKKKKKKEVKDLSRGTLMALTALRPGRCVMRMKVTSRSDTLQCLFPG